MADDKKKTKIDAAPKKDAAAKSDSTATGGTSKPESAAADGASKPESGEKDSAPSNYSRGEGQKPVTKAYKDNWNAIFGKKKKR